MIRRAAKGIDGVTGRRRRGAALVAAGVLVAVAVAPTTSVGAQTDSADTTAPTGSAPSSDVLVSGGGVRGEASTQVITVLPIIGDFGLPVRLGAAGSLADGEVRKASSHALALGLLGELATLAITGAPTLTRLGIPVSEFSGALKIPGATNADSREVTDAEERPAVPGVPIGPVLVGGAHQEAHAAEGGEARARTELGDVTIDLGIVKVEMNGGVAETIADANRAFGTTSIGELAFFTAGSKLATLEGLVWKWEQVLGQEPTASFAFGSASFGRLGFPAPAPGADTAADALTRALAPLGVSLTLPTTGPDGGLTPLRLALDDSPVGEAVVRPVYGALLADAVNQAQGAIVGGAPETGLVFTVANVVLSALTGQGGVAVELGGITGSMGRRAIEEFTYQSFPQPSRPSLPGLTSTFDRDTTSAPTPSASVSRVAGPTATAGGSPAPATETPAAPAAPQRSFARSLSPRLASVVEDEAFPALLVVLGGLGAAIAMAALDRRRIASIVHEATQGGAA